MTQPFSYYFPDTRTALDLMEKAIEKYRNHPVFILDNDKARGYLGKPYIDHALATIMYATGKEPKLTDLNTPMCYGWTFDETRDILGALGGLSKGDDFYWRITYEERFRPVVKNKTSVTALALMFFLTSCVMQDPKDPTEMPSDTLTPFDYIAFPAIALIWVVIVIVSIRQNKKK